MRENVTGRSEKVTGKFEREREGQTGMRKRMTGREERLTGKYEKQSDRQG